jgi:hypothetical protein
MGGAGWALSAYLRLCRDLTPFVTFYVAMAGASADRRGCLRRSRPHPNVEASVTWNYTTWLNVAFLVLAACLVWRF